MGVTEGEVQRLPLFYWPFFIGPFYWFEGTLATSIRMLTPVQQSLAKPMQPLASIMVVRSQFPFAGDDLRASGIGRSTRSWTALHEEHAVVARGPIVDSLLYP